MYEALAIITRPTCPDNGIVTRNFTELGNTIKWHQSPQRYQISSASPAVRAGPRILRTVLTTLRGKEARKHTQSQNTYALKQGRLCSQTSTAGIAHGLRYFANPETEIQKDRSSQGAHR